MAPFLFQQQAAYELDPRHGLAGGQRRRPSIQHDPFEELRKCGMDEGRNELMNEEVNP